MRRTGTCGYRGCVGGRPQPALTLPTVVTVVRTLLTVALISAAVEEGSTTLLFGGLAAYWVGDVADGVLARATDTETRMGAVLDILSDRLSVASGALILVMVVTHSAVAATALASAITAAKAYSFARLHRLPVPAQAGCAAPPVPAVGASS